MRMRQVAVLLALICLPAWADDGRNEARVAACLSDHPDSPGSCAPTILAACAEHREAGPAMVCYQALAETWNARRRAAVAPRPPQIAVVPWIHLLGFGKLIASETYRDCLGGGLDLAQLDVLDRPGRKAACQIVSQAMLWHQAEHGTGQMLADHARWQADRESLEACLLDSAVAGQTDACLGLILESCDTDGPAEGRLCPAWDTLVWRTLYQEMSKAVSAPAAHRIAEAHQPDATEQALCAGEDKRACFHARQARQRREAIAYFLEVEGQ